MKTGKDIKKTVLPQGRDKAGKVNERRKSRKKEEKMEFNFNFPIWPLLGAFSNTSSACTICKPFGTIVVQSAVFCEGKASKLFYKQT